MKNSLHRKVKKIFSLVLVFSLISSFLSPSLYVTNAIESEFNDGVYATEIDDSFFTNSYNITSNSTADSNVDSDVYNGETYAVYQRDSNLYFVKGIGEEQLIGAGNTPAIAVGPDGTAHVAYQSGTTVYYQNNKFGVWNSPISIIAGGITPDLDISPDGSVNVVLEWTNPANSWDRDNILKYTGDGEGSFTGSVILNGWYENTGGADYNSNNYSEPNIRIDNDGNYHITTVLRDRWKDMYGQTTNYYVKYLSNKSGGINTNTPSAGSYILTMPKNALSLDSSGTPHFLYKWTDGNYVLASYSSGWDANSLGAGISVPSLAVDGTKIGIAYVNSSLEVEYMEDSGSGFEGKAFVEIGGLTPSLSMGDGEVFVHYLKSDGDNEVKLKTSSPVYSVPGVIDETNNSFKYSSGIINLSGLEVGGTYYLTSGTGTVAGPLIATGSTGIIQLNPASFINYGNYTLSLNGSFGGVTTTDIDDISLYIGPADFQNIYDQVGNILDGLSIENNLSSVVYSNVANFSGLYFKKDGLGKITFTGDLDLTNSGTITFLTNLQDYLEMDDGYIELDGEEFASFPANIEMYGLPLAYSGITIDSSDFTVLNELGATLDASTFTSNYDVDCSGGIECSVSFDTQHFTSFNLNPFLTSVSISSNNPNSGTLAKVGNQITLNIVGSETLTGVTVTINGESAQSVIGTGSIWSATSNLIDSGDNGVVTFSIDYTDLDGVAGTTVTTTTNGSSVSVDTNSPTASVVYNPSTLTSGNVIATLTGASEPVTIVNNGGMNSYTFTNNGSFTFIIQDLAGNTGSIVATVNNINKSIPSITINGANPLTVERGTTYSELGATYSDQTDGTGVVSTISGSVNTYLVGTQYLNYIYTNSLGLSGTGIREVNVVDTIAPGTPVITNGVTLIGLPNIDIVGTGSGGEYIELYNSGILVGTGNIGLSGNFSKNILLNEGLNSINIKSYDDYGNYSGLSNTVNITRDSIDPTIIYTQVHNITNSGANFKFKFSEPNFINQVGVLNIQDSGSFDQNFSINFSGNIGTASITGLSSNTSYDFSLSLTDDVGNSVSENGAFSTPILVTGTGTLNETGPISLGFTGNVLEGQTHEMNQLNLIIQGDSNDSDYIQGALTLSGVNVGVDSGTWDGILLPPELIDPDSDEAGTGSEIGAGVTIVQTIKTGSNGAGLSAVGGYFNVSFKVSGYSSGTIFKLYRSQDGSNWLLNTPDSTCTLDASLMCNFRTDHLSYFAPGIDTTPDSFSFNAQTGKPLSTVYESNSITVSGINTITSISVSGGEYRIGGGSYTGATGTVNNGDLITVRLTSSSAYSTLTKATLNIGGVTADFNVTTMAGQSTSSSSGGGGSTVFETCKIENLECKLSISGVYKLYKKDGISCVGGDLGKVCNLEDIIGSGSGKLVNGRYVSMNTKINIFALKIDKKIENSDKVFMGDLLELRNNLIIELEKYINAFEVGDKKTMNSLKNGIVIIYKDFLKELSKKMYTTRNSIVSRIALKIDKNISKKISDENSEVWEYRNQFLEKLDELVDKQKTIDEQELNKLRLELIEIYKKILSAIK